MNTYDKLLDRIFILTKKVNGDVGSDIELLKNYLKADNDFVNYIFVQESIGKDIIDNYSNISSELKKVRTYFEKKYNFDIETSDYEQIEKYIKILERELKLNNLTNDN